MLNPYAAKYAHIMGKPMIIEEEIEPVVYIKETVDTALAEHFRISSQRRPSQ